MYNLYANKIHATSFARICPQVTFTPAAMSEPASKKRKTGGLHQRLKKASPVQSSKVYSYLLEKFASGKLSARVCLEIACAATSDNQAARDGCVFPDLEKFTELQQCNNSHRTMASALRSSSALPVPMKATLPFKGGEQVSCILLPHEFFAAMYCRPELWEKTIMPDESKLPKLWQSMQDHPSLQGHPALERADFRERCLPLALHGDEVPVQGVGKVWSCSALVFSWYSLLAQSLGGNTKDTMNYVWSVFDKFAKPSTDSAFGTVDAFFDILRWSFEILLSGVWPEADHRGVRCHS